MLAKVDEMFGKIRVTEQLFLIYDKDNIRNNCSLVPTIHELERLEKKLLEKWLNELELQEEKLLWKWLRESEQQKKKLLDKCQHEKKKELLEKDTIVNAWVDIKKIIAVREQLIHRHMVGLMHRDSNSLAILSFFG